jgi:hypothetical protein
MYKKYIMSRKYCKKDIELTLIHAKRPFILLQVLHQYITYNILITNFYFIQNLLLALFTSTKPLNSTSISHG